MAEAERTDPDLWETVKKEITDSDKGGEPGQWSARKAQMAVQEYKKRGGGYADDGPEQEETDLHQWTAEDWGTKSGEDSLQSGERYLPKKVRMLLTEDEYARSTSRKRGANAQFVDQPDDVRDTVGHIKAHGPTKAMLEERAADLDIDGRSSMSKDELLRAIEEATDDNGRARGAATALDAKTKDELEQMARDRDIRGRSEMSKDELVDALAAKDREELSSETREELYRMAQDRGIDGRSEMSKDELIAALS